MLSYKRREISRPDRTGTDLWLGSRKHRLWGSDKVTDDLAMTFVITIMEMETKKKTE